jgi:hypothetical protein
MHETITCTKYKILQCVRQNMDKVRQSETTKLAASIWTQNNSNIV